MFDHKTVTKTQKTATYYEKVGRNILEKFSAETDLDYDLHPDALIEWLEVWCSTRSPSTWRLVRSSIAHYIKILGFNEIANSVIAISTKRCSPPQKRTAAKKKKSISDAELMGLSNELRKPGATQLARESYNFLVSCMLTGMRPVEWSDCVVEVLATPTEGNPYADVRLDVRNAKATNGRAHGERRTLLLEAMGEPEYLVLQAHLSAIQRELANGTFEAFQKRCSDRIYLASKTLWPTKSRRVNLYSGRHQSIANCKADGKTKAETAALHGHFSDRTATDHYGRTQYGHAGRTKLIPNEDEVARVREVPRDWTPPNRHQDIENDQEKI